MYWLFVVFLGLEFIFDIYFLVKSIKTRDNRNWLILFSINVSSIISVFLFGWYSLFALANKTLKYFIIYFIIYVLVFVVNLLLLIISSILKINEAINNKRRNIMPIVLTRKVKCKSIFIPLILIILFTLCLCGIDYSKDVIQKRGELNTYNNVKKKEINKMVSFLNDKYSINIMNSDCVYYREQDYTTHNGFMYSTTFNIPYIGVFKYNNELITVADRKGFISDNRQLGEINDILIEYYYNKTGIKFDYIEFSKGSGSNWCGDDNIINIILQTKFNELITDDNVEEFLNYVLQEANLSISFYISNVDNMDVLKDDIIDELEYLREYDNILSVNVYGYTGELDIIHREILFPDEKGDYDIETNDIDDGYKFGCYYQDERSIDYSFELSMDLDRGYSSYEGVSINGWKYRVYN